MPLYWDNEMRSKMMANVNKDKIFNPFFQVMKKASEKTPWKDDVLERQKFAKPLTDLVISAGDAPFCIAVDGEWGSGKTFLLERWRAEFSEKGKAIYFNAWKDDFHADPLTAIIGQLWNELEKGKMKDIGNLLKENWWNAVKEATLNLSYFGIRLGDAQSPARKTMKEYLNGRQSVDVLQKQLRKLAKVTKEKTEKPLVIIVDELDRCRPTFGIELLERVKHVVGVEGIVFVFGVNQKGLEKSIRSVYGDIDATDYLRRFFDVGMTLPKAGASNYCKYLIKRHKIAKAITESPTHQRTYKLSFLAQKIKWKSDWNETVKNDMPIMVDYMGLSLRQIEQAVRMLLVILRSKEIAKTKKMYRFEGCLVAFILLRIKDRDLYTRFINENCTIKDILDSVLPLLSWRNDRMASFHVERVRRVAKFISFFYFFCTRAERAEIIAEYEQVVKISSMTGMSLPTYYHVPQKIIEIKSSNMQLYLVRELISRIRSFETIRANHPSSLTRRAIVRLLEWGDYWQD